MNRLTFSRLSDLIRVCNVREDAYHKVYESLSDSPIAFIFKKYANESNLFCKELERYITKYPSRQEDDYDRFVEYKWNKMIGQLKRQQLMETIKECIDCESRTISFYKAFLNDYLSEELRGKVVRQLVQIEKAQSILHKFYQNKELVGTSGIA